MNRYKFNLYDVESIMSHLNQMDISVVSLSISQNTYLVVEVNEQLPSDLLDHLSGVQI